LCSSWCCSRRMACDCVSILADVVAAAAEALHCRSVWTVLCMHLQYRVRHATRVLVSKHHPWGCFSGCNGWGASPDGGGNSRHPIAAGFCRRGRGMCATGSNQSLCRALLALQGSALCAANPSSWFLSQARGKHGSVLAWITVQKASDCCMHRHAPVGTQPGAALGSNRMHAAVVAWMACSRGTMLFWDIGRWQNHMHLAGCVVWCMACEVGI
jgi:hypothetical protein